MSAHTHTGIHYLKSYPGLLKIAEEIVNITLLILTNLIETTFQSNFLCGIAVYALLSVNVLFILNITGVTKSSDVPWLWLEWSNSTLLTVFFCLGSSLVVFILTRAYIITGLIGFITAAVYTLDSIEHFKSARMPRAKYVWTVPNMPN